MAGHRQPSYLHRMIRVGKHHPIGRQMPPRRSMCRAPDCSGLSGIPQIHHRRDRHEQEAAQGRAGRLAVATPGLRGQSARGVLAAGDTGRATRSGQEEELVPAAQDPLGPRRTGRHRHRRDGHERRGQRRVGPGDGGARGHGVGAGRARHAPGGRGEGREARGEAAEVEYARHRRPGARRQVRVHRHQGQARCGVGRCGLHGRKSPG